MVKLGDSIQLVPLGSGTGVVEGGGLGVGDEVGVGVGVGVGVLATALHIQVQSAELSITFCFCPSFAREQLRFFKTGRKLNGVGGAKSSAHTHAHEGSALGVGDEGPIELPTFETALCAEFETTLPGLQL